MRYPVNLEGFEGHRIEVEPPRIFGGTNLYIDGMPAPKQRGRYLLKRDDGQDVPIKLRPSLFYDAPILEVGGKNIQVVEPLAWYQYLLSSVPVVMVIGGIIGMLVGIVVVMGNIRIFRSERSTAAKYGLVCLLSFGVPIACFAASFLASLASN